MSVQTPDRTWAEIVVQVLKANEVRADFSLLDYVLHRQLIIHTISIHSPDFTFVKNPNGAWSWTTLGPKKAPANAPETNAAVALPQVLNDPLALLIAVAPSQLRHVDIDAANVRLVDKVGEQSSESLYKNVALTTDLDREVFDAKAQWCLLTRL